ncbi:MAG: putative selenium-dependent hydroxylase accessory protein YqeC [Clostridiaceae bacterium]|jgi:molybdenum cofactor cytidylyltransferase|nr:putative selenium-dependent hydroxylase accessory protein YqeC [Clostridiaceae bacterium]
MPNQHNDLVGCGRLTETSLEAYVRTLISLSDERYPSPFVVSAIGGGGKTTTLMELFAGSLRNRSILTTTTAMGAPRANNRISPPLPPGCELLPALGRISLTPPAESGVWFGPAFEGIPDKYSGVDLEDLDDWIRDRRHARDGETVVFCEADGSKRKPLKAHASHEPVIPKTTDLTLIVFGLSGVGQPLDESVVHRSHLFTEQTGLQPGNPIEMANLLTLIDNGHFFKNIPPTSRVAVVFNQTDYLDKSRRDRSQLATVAKRTLSNSRIDAVFFNANTDSGRQTLYGIHRQEDKTALFSAVLMAAGMSTRMGEPNKLLLPVGNRTVIFHTLTNVLQSDVRDLVIVTGHQSSAVRAEIVQAIAAYAQPSTRVTVVDNKRYREGQGTSVALATQNLAEESVACFYIPGDQPFVSPILMRHLAEELEPGKILIPVKEGKRSAPALFDRIFYDELSVLMGDMGGRQVIDKHEKNVVEIVDTGDAIGSFDLDTPDDYRKILDLV